jgi:cytochrome c-type biogenesis protein CcmH/NrfF
VARVFLILALTVGILISTEGPVFASEQSPTLEELEAEVMCPTCNAPLNRSHAPIADRIRAFIINRIALGSTKSEIKDELVVEFGERVLTSPTRGGLNVIAWALPLVGVVIAGTAVYVVLRRWSRSKTQRGLAAEGGLDPELERAVDEALDRYDRT